MTIAKDKIRKEVHLTQDILDALQKRADSEQRTLKNLLEYVLTQHAKIYMKK